MNATKAGNGSGAYTGGIPLNVTLHAWPVPKLHPDPKQFNQTNAINVRNSESAKNFTNRLHNLNATGYVAIDEDLTDTGFTDVQTLILAGIATLIPLFIGVAVILGIRFLWKRYRQRKGEGYEGVLQREESSEPSRKAEGRNLPLELKNSESQFSVNPGGEMTNGSSPQVLTPKSNGSVITMTLKNNHLIVETEETNDTLDGIKIESQGTTTKYVTPTAPEFRVTIPSTEEQEKGAGPQEIDGTTASTDHGALVHRPPKEVEEETDRESCNTGLSQSDLSVSSTESQNPSYRYGNQTGYDSGGYGYPEYPGYSTIGEGKPTSNTKGPREHKGYYRSSSTIDRTDSVTVGASAGDQQGDTPLSDTEARDTRLEDGKKDERCEDEQRALGNGDISPKMAVEANEMDGENKTDDADPGSSKGPQFSGKVPRCDQLKSEASPADEIECYPNNILKNAADSSVNS